MKNYINAVQAVIATNATQHYYIQYEHLKRTQKGNLERIVNNAQNIQDQSTALSENMTEYIQKLEEFFKDYQTSKEQGFTSTNRNHHTAMMSKLSRQIKAAKNLNGKLKKISTKMTDAGHAYESLAAAELMRIETEEPISAKNAITLERQNNSIVYPTISSNNLAQKIVKVLDTDVMPIP